MKSGSVHSVKFLRQRNFFLVLPILVLPFLVMLLWSLGLVGEVKASDSSQVKSVGLNLNLPSAVPSKDSTWDKMKYYEQADRDSVKLRSYLKSDPYRKLELEESKFRIDSFIGSDRSGGSRNRYDPYMTASGRDANEERVYKKLSELNNELEKVDKGASPARAPDTIAPAVSPDVQRLEAMMQSIQTDPGENKELMQVNQMLDKIMRIQHPDEGDLEDSLQELSSKNKQRVYPVQAHRDDIVSIIPNEIIEFSDSVLSNIGKEIELNRFYSLEDNETIDVSTAGIAAIIHEDQSLVSGGTVKLSILEAVYIGGVSIPAGHLIYGTAALNGERLSIKINSVVLGNHLLPVALKVYDADGIAGVHVPGALTRDVVKRSAAQSVQGLGSIGNLDPSFGAQIATAGLQAAQNLIGKSAKLVHVHLKAGYHVLLRDDNTK